MFSSKDRATYTHTAIDATLDLVQSHGINPEDVEEVLVETYSDAVDKAGEEMPRSTYKAKFSLKYCVAVSILDKKCSLEQFSQRKLKDKRIWKLADKISVSVNPKLNREYPEKWPAIVTIKTSGGVFSEKCEYPKGDPRNPIVESELTEKFIELTSPLLKRDKSRQIIKKVMNFEDLTS